MPETSTDPQQIRQALASEEGPMRWLRRGLTALLVAALAAGGVAWRIKNRPPPTSRYITSELSTGDVIEKVQATGTVQPILQVTVGAQVNGRVTSVLVDYNSIVKQGDVLAEIDPTIYGTQVSAQQANVSAQVAQLKSARAQADAVISQAETARLNYERVRKLNEQGLSSRAELDATKGAYDAAMAQADAARANVAAAGAAISASQAQLTQLKTNLGYTKIYSPLDGIVVSRGIDPGATVVASFQAPALFVIAQNLRKMRILADVDEADVGKIREKMGATSTVDAFPGDSFRGVLAQIRFNPNTVQGVVTYSAIVEVDNPEEKLRPGMTATVTIHTHEAFRVLRVPNAALRFKPSRVAKDAKEPSKAGSVEAKEPELPSPGKGKGRIYVLVDSTPGKERIEPVVVDVGATDGASTEVRGGTLAEGTKVVTDENQSEDDKKKARRVF